MTSVVFHDLAALAEQVVAEGWCVTDPVVEAPLLDRVIRETAGVDARAGLRNLLDRAPSACALARHPAVRLLPERILGRECFVARAILFDKTPEANWKVPWHQDLAIAVRERVDQPEFGPWSVKEGVVHVQPPASVLERMVTIRVHLDECGAENGPVRVLSGSHLEGKIDQAQIERIVAARDAVACTVRRGGLLAFVPLLLHASSPATIPGHRRVAHFEFAIDDLPGGLEWRMRWS